MLASTQEERPHEQDEVAAEMPADLQQRSQPWPNAADLLRMAQDERLAWERIIAEALC